MERCQIIGGTCNHYLNTGTGNIMGGSGASGIDADGGTIVNCLVISNAQITARQKITNPYYADRRGYSPVTLRGTAKMINCTVANNNGLGCGGIYCLDEAQAINCAIFGGEMGPEAMTNGTPKTAFAWRGDGSHFVNCATEAAYPIAGGTGCVSGDFRIDGGGFAPTTAHSVVVDKGQKRDEAGLVDLAGSPRVSGGVIDIGCYELLQNDSVLDVSLQKVSQSHKDVPADVVFASGAYGVAEGVTYFWDFDGDGVWDRTGEDATATWRYETEGDYTVRVRALHLATGRIGERTLDVSVLPHQFRGFVISLRGPKPVDYSAWRVKVLDPTHLVVQFDCRSREKDEFRVSKETLAQTGWPLQQGLLNAGRRTQAYRAELEEKLREGAVHVAGDAVAAQGFWEHPIGQSAFKVRGRDYPVKLPDLIYNVYIVLKEPMEAGVKNTIHMPDGTDLPVTYDPDTPSPLFKVNQVGYMPDAKEKYAYVGQWLGSLGPYPAPDESKRAFEVVNAETGEVALTGRLTQDPNRVDVIVGDNDTPCTGEDTLEADISALKKEGTYYIRVPGVGRSRDFTVRGQSMADQFAVHMNGLYVQRCGIAKEEPYTHWTDGVCHRRIWRGVHCTAEGNYTDGCFTLADGTPIETDHFSVIGANCDAITNSTPSLFLPGGWHDAADYDRRGNHMRIVNELCWVYLMRPENFTDDQLAIPECTNNIPDILDEADWGLQHILASQREDGGVGLWIETYGHPVAVNQQMPSEDPRPYFIANPTRGASLTYAATASLLARALTRAGTPEALARAKTYLDSAKRAWNFAMGPRQEKIPLLLTVGKETQTVYYQESADVGGVEMLRTAVNLTSLTGDRQYIDTITTNHTSAINASMGNGDHSWSRLYLMDIFLPFETEEGTKILEANDRVATMRNRYRYRVLIAYAPFMLDGMTNSVAYRPCWFSPTEKYWQFTGMSWGAVMPLRQAEALCAAHYIMSHSLTNGAAKTDLVRYLPAETYLNAAYLAADFHCGCNPNGATWTCGLGEEYPVRYLSLHSLADDIEEYVRGITPYRNSYGFPYQLRDENLMPEFYRTHMSEKPIWRRWENVESYTVAPSEYTVTETIGPSAACAGYLMDARANKPNRTWPPPAKALPDLPGYWTLP